MIVVSIALIVFGLCYSDNFFAMSRIDKLAINSIEKEIALLGATKDRDRDWGKKIDVLAGQLQSRYVPLGYDAERVSDVVRAAVQGDEEIESEGSVEPLSEDSALPALHSVPKIVHKSESAQGPVIISGQADSIPEEPQEISQELHSVSKIVHKPESAQGPVIISGQADSIPAESQELHSVPKIVHNSNNEYELAIISEQAGMVPKEPTIIAGSSKNSAYQEDPEGPKISPKEPLAKTLLTEQKDNPELKMPVVQVLYKECIPEGTQQEVTDELDKMIGMSAAQKDDQWDKVVNSLLHDLYFYDQTKAADYLAAIYKQLKSVPCVPCVPEKISEVVVLSVPSSTPPPPPPLFPQAGQKKGGTPPPPPPPPKNNGSVKKNANNTSPKELIVEKPKKFVITPKALRELTNEGIEKLFNEQIEVLKSNWNVLFEQMVEVRTKYGVRKEMVRGTPTLEWKNGIGAIRRSLLEKNIMTQAEIDQKINARIEQVRVEKKTAIADVTSIAPKQVEEEITRETVERQVKQLLADPKGTMGWLVSAKGTIKKLNEFDHELALKYQAQFLKLEPGEKIFIKP